MLKKILFSAAFAPCLALLLIGLNPGQLPAQGGEASEITAGPVRVSPAAQTAPEAPAQPAPAAPAPQPAPAAQPAQPPAAPPPVALPDAFKTPAPAPVQAPVQDPAPASVPAPAPVQTPKAPAPAPPAPPRADESAEITKELAAADSSYRQGDYIAALDALWAAQEMMWRRAPLGVRNVAFVTEQPENFGTYKPKTGEDFKSPEPLILYCEPIGFTQVKENETYKYSIIGAFDILDSNGRVLGGQKNLGPYEQSGYRTFSTETMLVMTIGIHGLPAGAYVMRVTLTDNLDRTKSVQLDKPFNIIE